MRTSICWSLPGTSQEPGRDSRELGYREGGRRPGIVDVAGRRARGELGRRWPGRDLSADRAPPVVARLTGPRAGGRGTASPRAAPRSSCAAGRAGAQRGGPGDAPGASRRPARLVLPPGPARAETGARALAVARYGRRRPSLPRRSTRSTPSPPGLRLLARGAELAKALGLPATDQLDWEIRHAASRPRGTFHLQALADRRGLLGRAEVLRHALLPSREWIARELSMGAQRRRHARPRLPRASRARPRLGRQRVAVSATFTARRLTPPTLAFSVHRRHARAPPLRRRELRTTSGASPRSSHTFANRGTRACEFAARKPRERRCTRSPWHSGEVKAGAINELSILYELSRGTSWDPPRCSSHKRDSRALGGLRVQLNVLHVVVGKQSLHRRSTGALLAAAAAANDLVARGAALRVVLRAFLGRRRHCRLGDRRLDGHDQGRGRGGGPDLRSPDGEVAAGQDRARMRDLPADRASGAPRGRG